jgi:hypothetical protein
MYYYKGRLGSCKSDQTDLYRVDRTRRKRERKATTTEQGDRARKKGNSSTNTSRKGVKFQKLV